MRRWIALLLAMALLAGSLAACGERPAAEESGPAEGDVAEATGPAVGSEGEGWEDGDASGGPDTLTIATLPFDGVFGPTFASGEADRKVPDLVFAPFARADASGRLADGLGHVDAEEVTAEDGHAQTKYTLTLKPGLSFSDGEPITIDDMIFTLYVMADPAYDGESPISSLDIVGMKEYCYDTENYGQILDEVTQRYSPENISEMDFIAYLVDTGLEGWFDGKLPGDADGKGMSWADYLANYGYDASGITDPAEMLSLLARCEYENFRDIYDPLSYYSQKVTFGSLEDGVDVEEISGIERVDDLTMTILFDSPDISGDRLVAGLPLMPEHYYGEGWSKGDLSGIRKLDAAPLGAGPYAFVSYEGGVVTLRANERYFLGAPLIPNVRLRAAADEEEKVGLIATGEADVTDFGASRDTDAGAIPEMRERIGKEEGMGYVPVSGQGYGYIGINAERIPDANVRKGLLHLMNRAPAIESYYGDLGAVIERPMDPTVPEYPSDAAEYYGYDKAKALELFQEAGYAQADGKLAKDGEQLSVTVGVAGLSSHPCAQILTQMRDDLEAMGAELIVSDMPFSELTGKLEDGALDMWAAWGNESADCDLSETFGSEGAFNYQRYYSEEIDALQGEILQTIDFDERRGLVAKELDAIMDAAVYMPVYQKRSMVIYDAESVDGATLPSGMTARWGIAAQIEKLRMKG